MILIAVIVAIAGLVSAFWGLYNFWRRPGAAVLAIIVAWVLVGLSVGIIEMVGGR